MLYVCFPTNRSQIFFLAFLRMRFEIWNRNGSLAPARKNIALLICQSAEVRKALLEACDYAKMHYSNK